ncbi:MAG: hypothetical protein F4210_09140 [Holophagales bacterium]|nr:hypothetical protein [Holophagales bacterium]MYF95657.1 hypothetical protein [Holophagales bacterium]
MLLAACATGGGPAPEEPAATAAADATTVAAATAEAELTAAPEAPAAADVASAAAEPEAASSPVAAYLEDPAAITAGRRMFRAVCTGYCHSTTPGVTKDAPNLFDCAWDHGNTDADLYRVINQGVPDTEMLPFEGKIPEDTIWKVIAYMRSNSLDCG